MNRIGLLTAVAAIALPAAMAGAQVAAPAGTAPPVTGSANTGAQTGIPVPSTGTPPVDHLADHIAQPVTEAAQQAEDATATAAQQAHNTAERTADAVEADATAQAQAQAQAQPAAPATAPGPVTAATAADVRAGITVHDQSGGLVGTVESADADSAVITTGTARADVPLASLGRSPRGLVISVTRAEFEAAIAARTPAPAPGS